MTQPTPIPDAMIEAAAAELGSHRGLSLVDHWWCECGAGEDVGSQGESDTGISRHMAGAVLGAALAVCESHTEWASEHTGDFNSMPSPYVMETGRDERLARMRVRAWREDRGLVYPGVVVAWDVASRLLRRTVTVVYGGWEPTEDVPGGER